MIYQNFMFINVSNSAVLFKDKSYTLFISVEQYLL